MTERREEALGSGPDGLVIPEDLMEQEDRRSGDEPDWDLIDRHTERVMVVLRTVLAEHARKLDSIERLLERFSCTVEARLQGLSLDLAGIEGVQPGLARKFQVEDVLANQKREFDYLKESHAWLRGALTVGAPAARPDPAPRSRAGVAMLWLLWALTVAAAFGAGAVAFGGLRVDVAWEQGSARPAAAAPASRRSLSLDERRRERALAEGASRHIDAMTELEQRERARAEGSRPAPVLVPLRPEAVSPGEDGRWWVGPVEPSPDLAIPGEDVRPAYGPAPGPPAGQGAPVRSGPLVAEPGAP